MDIADIDREVAFDIDEDKDRDEDGLERLSVGCDGAWCSVGCDGSTSDWSAFTTVSCLRAGGREPVPELDEGGIGRGGGTFTNECVS